MMNFQFYARALCKLDVNLYFFQLPTVFDAFVTNNERIWGEILRSRVALQKKIGPQREKKK